ncbi:MAG TPA: glycosyltransferase [Saprospiraceae bacterium]|nr:glycosyltransferase [Saprospiraceae bacterium]
MARYFPLLREITEAILITAPVKGLTQQEPGVIRTGFQIKPISTLRKQLKQNWFLSRLHTCILPDDKVVYQIWYLIHYLIKCHRKSDLIITVSNPFSSHLIGLTLKYIRGHSWIADIGDVYTHSPKNHGISKLKQTFEDLVLREADHVIVNAQSLKEFYHEHRGMAEDKISVIPNGISVAPSMIAHQPSDTLRLSYIGNTYGGIREGLREMEVLLTTIRKQIPTKCRIHLFGSQFHELENLALQNIDCVTLDTCRNDFELADAYSKTDILLNFANSDYPGLPSKLEEYVATGLPIINFYYSKDEASISFLNSTKCRVFHVNLKHPELASLHDFFKTIQAGAQTSSTNDSIPLKEHWHEVLSMHHFVF